MAKNKGVRIVITLECTECRSNPAKRSPGVSRYTTEKNRGNTTERLEISTRCLYCALLQSRSFLLADTDQAKLPRR